MMARVVKSVVMGGGLVALGTMLPTKWRELMRHRQRRLNNIKFA